MDECIVLYVALRCCDGMNINDMMIQMMDDDE